VVSQRKCGHMRKYDESTHDDRPTRVARTPGSRESAAPRPLIAQRLANPEAMLDMQRLAGNSAVVQLLEDGSTETEDSPQSSAPSADEFAAKFDTDDVVTRMADEADEHQGADETQNVQALALQRDPTPTPGATPGTTPAPQAAADASASATRPGSAGDVLSALAAEPPFKEALEKLKAEILADWQKFLDATSPVEKTAVFTAAGAVAAGAVGGAMSNKASRSFLLDKLNGVKIPLPAPGLPPTWELSVSPKIGDSKLQGGMIFLQGKF
jgi:hypothetical protein